MHVTIRIKMLKDEMGHDVDHKGVTLPAKLYKKDEEHEVHESLANCFLQTKSAVKSEGSKHEEPNEPKNEQEPMNDEQDQAVHEKKKKKMNAGAPENK